MKKTLLSLFPLALLAVPSQGAVIYRETFGNATGVNALTPTVGWTATTAWGVGFALGRVQNLDNVNAGTSTSQTNGYLFYGSATGNATTIVYTTEYALSESTVSQLDTFSWAQGHANASTASRLAIRIGSNWYVSSASFANAAMNAATFASSGEQKTFNWTTDASAWRNVTVAGATVTLGSVLSADLNTTGGISAFGLFATNTNEVRRVDTFEINTIPEPTSALLGGLGLLFLLRRRR